MSKSFNSALDFMPEAKTGHGGFWNSLNLLLEAIADGRRAESDYRRLTASGVDPSTAAGIVFNQTYKTK